MGIPQIYGTPPGLHTLAVSSQNFSSPAAESSSTNSTKSCVSLRSAWRPFRKAKTLRWVLPIPPLFLGEILRWPSLPCSNTKWIQMVKPQFQIHFNINGFLQSGKIIELNELYKWKGIVDLADIKKSCSSYQTIKHSSWIGDRAPSTSPTDSKTICVRQALCEQLHSYNVFHIPLIATGVSLEDHTMQEAIRLILFDHRV